MQVMFINTRVTVIIILAHMFNSCLWTWNPKREIKYKIMKNKYKERWYYNQRIRHFQQILEDKDKWLDR